MEEAGDRTSRGLEAGGWRQGRGARGVGSKAAPDTLMLSALEVPLSWVRSNDISLMELEI